MKDTTIGTGSPVYFSIRQAAWLLGVSESRVCRAIRVGTLRAVRRLRPDAIPDAVLHRVLEAATFAPTGGNVQPWRIVAVKDPAQKAPIGRWWLLEAAQGVTRGHASSVRSPDVLAHRAFPGVRP